MTVFLPKWLKNGFQTSGAQPKPVKNKELILHLLALLHKRGPLNGVKFKHVAAHRGEVGNEGADVSSVEVLLPPLMGWAATGESRSLWCTCT